MINKLLTCLLLVGLTYPAKSKTFVQSGYGYSVIMDVHKIDSSLTVNYTIYNTSNSLLLFSPSADVAHYLLNDSRYTTMSLQMGALRFSSLIGGGSVLLQTLAPHDSVKITKEFKTGRFKTKICFEFDCLVLEKLPRNKRRSLKRHYPALTTINEGYNIDHAEYYELYTDLFSFEIPLECLDK